MLKISFLTAGLHLRLVTLLVNQSSVLPKTVTNILRSLLVMPLFTLYSIILLFVNITTLYPAIAGKNKQISKTIIAKEIAKIVYHVLKNKSDFNNYFKGQEPDHKKSLTMAACSKPLRITDSFGIIVALDLPVRQASW